MSSLVEWWSLPFTIPFALGVLYLLLTTTGLMQSDDGDAEAADVAGGDAGDAGGEPVDPAGDIDETSGGGTRVLDLLGLGRVPLSLVIQLFLLVWGFSGWAAVSVLAPLIGEPLLFVWPALLIAAVTATAITIGLARPLARWLPSTESHSVAKRQLAGRLGIAVLPVSATGGLVQVRDGHGNVHQIACHVALVDGSASGNGRDSGNGRNGSGPRTIPKGAEVIVVSYDETTGRYAVVESDLPGRR